jgi:hypothetical protein
MATLEPGYDLELANVAASGCCLPAPVGALARSFLPAITCLFCVRTLEQQRQS